MCGSIVDVKSARLAEIRRGKKRRITKKKKKKEEETTGRKYNARICYAGRPQNANLFYVVFMP